MIGATSETREILLMEEILLTSTNQLRLVVYPIIWYLQGFIPRWLFGISSINTMFVFQAVFWHASRANVHTRIYHLYINLYIHIWNMFLYLEHTDIHSKTVTWGTYIFVHTACCSVNPDSAVWMDGVTVECMLQTSPLVAFDEGSDLVWFHVSHKRVSTYQLVWNCKQDNNTYCFQKIWHTKFVPCMPIQHGFAIRGVSFAPTM